MIFILYNRDRKCSLNRKLFFKSPNRLNGLKAGYIVCRKIQYIRTGNILFRTWTMVMRSDFYTHLGKLFHLKKSSNILSGCGRYRTQRKASTAYLNFWIVVYDCDNNIFMHIPGHTSYTTHKCIDRTHLMKDR